MHNQGNIDKNTLIRLKQGDIASFDAIYWKYSAWVYNFIFSLLHDKLLAEDLTQNVFLKIWERKDSIDAGQSFESYIFTIARNLVYKETEKALLAEKYIETIQKQDIEYDSGPEEKVETKLLQEYIASLVEQLPEARKNIYKLSRMEQLSNKEIAAKLSISERTVETQLYRALQFLKQNLSKDSGLMLLLALLFVK